MNSRDAFGLAVRSLGLLLLVAGVLYFISGIMLWVDPKFHLGASPAWHYFLESAIWLIIGCYFLRGASLLVRFAYPEERTPRPMPPNS